MKITRWLLGAVAALCLSAPCFAQIDLIEAQQSGSKLKAWGGGKVYINCSTGMTCTYAGGKFVLTASGAFAPPITAAQDANGHETIVLTRATDSVPTGNFLNFLNAALASVFKVDVAGVVTAAGINVTPTGGVGGSFNWPEGTIPTTDSAGNPFGGTGFDGCYGNSTAHGATCKFNGGTPFNIGPRRFSCQTGIGDGLNAIPAGTYLQSFCYNDTGVTVTLSGLKCNTDNSGSSTMNAAGNTLGALLTGAVTCTNAFAAGTQSANVALTNGDYIKFTFVGDGTSKQTTWVVTGTY